MTKVLILISDIEKSIQFEWLAKGFLNYNESIQVQYILLNSRESDFELFLKNNDIKVTRFSSSSNLLCTIKLIFFLMKNRPDVIHYHLSRASIIGSFSSFLLRIKKRVWTRHHSDYHRVYFPKGRKWDQLVNELSTDIIAISEVVKEELIKFENVSLKKINLIHHGLNFSEIAVNDSSIMGMKKKYDLNGKYPVIGVISRYEKLKGLIYIIEAIEQVLLIYPNAKLVLANAKGPDLDIIQKTLKNKFNEKQYREINFEPDVFSLYKCFDIFIHTPISSTCEAFGLTYIESLYSKIPSIFSLSGVAHEFIQNKKNALVVPYESSTDIKNSILYILESPKSKIQLLIDNGYNLVIEKFDIKPVVIAHKNLYLQKNG